MSSVRQIKIAETSRVPVAVIHSAFHSLRHEIYAMKGSNQSSVHPRGKILFVEGESARGIYLLRAGKATASISSGEGRVVILRIALPGDVLGLSSVLQNSPYDRTVKTIEPCRTDFISRAELLKLMERSKPATGALLKILSRQLTELADRTTSLVLPTTAVAKLANLLLEWCGEPGVRKSHTGQINKSFTQEEIGQMICSSRETVTRLLAVLRRRKIVQITSDSIVIQDRPALQALALC